jgi:hypothetical protein
MPGQLRHGCDVHTLVQKIRNEGSPQIVEVNIRHFGLSRALHEQFIRSARDSA